MATVKRSVIGRGLSPVQHLTAGRALSVSARSTLLSPGHVLEMAARNHEAPLRSHFLHPTAASRLCMGGLFELQSEMGRPVFGDSNTQ